MQRIRLAYAIVRLGASFFDRVRLALWVAACYIQFLCGWSYAPSVRVSIQHKATVFPVWLMGIVDLWVLKDVFIDREYAVSLPRTPETIVDVGCNVGLSTAFLAAEYPAAHIYATEPNPLLKERLTYNTKLFQNVSLYSFAVGDTTGESTFYLSDTATSSSLRAGTGAPVPVSVVAVGDLCQALSITHIGLLKFDIEGAERCFFAAPAFFNYVDNLIGEMHYDRLGCKPSDIATPNGFVRTERMVKDTRSILLLMRANQ